MPRTLKFSNMHLVVQELKAKLQADMVLYGNQRGVDISMLDLDYSTAWSDFMRMAIYGGSPDVSELGSTWINDFGSMHVMRPYSSADIKLVGGQEAFVPAIWQSGVSRDGEVWAVPWMTDLNLVFYRRDLFAKAGVKEEGAFSTPERFLQTLAQLKDAGIEVPFTASSKRSYMMVHSLAMWLWNAGTDFVDESGKKLLLDTEPALTALRNFLTQYRYIPQQYQGVVETDADGLFIQGKAAVDVTGSWVISSTMNTEVGANLGLAIPFQRAYVGGSGLVIWKQNYEAREAVNLVAHLTSQPFQTVFPKIVGLLPSRMDSLETFPLPDPAMYAVIREGLASGHSLPQVPLWGAVEDRLVNGLSAMIADMYARPEVDLDAIIDEHLTPLARRLEITLSQ
jgi:multiple sugar transport system substrate-binding protein